MGLFLGDKMEFILDFQGYKNKNNDFIVKELALISTDEQFYELHLFKPPCDFNRLPPDVQKQVVWLEKQCHGLYWGSGFTAYSGLKDIFRKFSLYGKVYVKGSEKEKFIKNLLCDVSTNVEVLDLEKVGCPNLAVLRKEMMMNNLKPCIFNHSLNNCAYVNVHAILQWWKLEKLVFNKINLVDRALHECYEKGYYKMNIDLIKYLPKEFILNHHERVDIIYDKLSDKLKSDKDILANMSCNDHFFSTVYNDQLEGFPPKRKNCYFCSNNIKMNV